MEKIDKIMEKNFNIGKNNSIYAKIYNYNEYSKKVMIVCHGFCSSKDSASVQEIAKSFSKLNIPIIAFDWPSHGQSEEILSINKCKETFESIQEYVQKLYPTAKKYLYGSSFGAYMLMLCLCNGNVKNCECIFLKSPAIKMDKILVNSLLEEDFESFQRNGFTIKKNRGNLIIPYEFYKELLQNKINPEQFKSLKNRILIFHGTDDSVAPIGDVRECVGGRITLTELQGAEHSFKGQYLDKMINSIIREFEESELSILER